MAQRLKGSLLASSIILSSIVLTRYWYYRRKRNIDDRYEIPSDLLFGDYSDELKLAVECALKAGENMVPFLESKGTSKQSSMDQSLRLSTKSSEADLCTAIDVQNETLITSAINNHFPQHLVIGEESTGSGAPPLLTKQPTWIIDPIDGTTNFASGSPFTCVSIGFCDHGEPVLGVVYAPGTHELYVAIKGRGAFRNGVPLRHQSLSEKLLRNAVICFEFGYVRSHDGLDKMLEVVKRIMKHGCRSTRSYGSGALDLCYVGSGRIDVVYTGVSEEGWKPWDYCAALVIVKEAGCTICPLFDELNTTEFSVYSKSMICGVTAGLVDECKRVIHG